MNRYRSYIIMLSSLLLITASHLVDIGPAGLAESTHTLRLSNPGGVRVIRPNSLRINDFSALELIRDGSFEEGLPNPHWQDKSALWEANIYQDDGAHSGLWLIWMAGGNSYGGAETASVDQNIIIPTANIAMLRFWLLISRAETTGMLNVRLDDQVVFTVTEADSETYEQWTQIAVDIKQFANGENHNLIFQAVISAEDGATDILIDDVSVIVDSPFFKGDMNGDMRIDLKDAVLALQVLNGMIPENIRSDYSGSGADVNNDQKIGLEEGVYILEIVSGLDKSTIHPINQFNIGDSIGEGVAANGIIGARNHDIVWSTGYDASDIVYSLNERLEDKDPSLYYENNATMDGYFNKAVSGAGMSDFADQASNVVSEATTIGGAGMVTILLGNNDVCADSLSTMTPIEEFEAQYRTGLDILAASDATKEAQIHVSGIPDIYWLWVAKKDISNCSFMWWFGSVCQALLENPEDDCESIKSRDDPDTVYLGDGPNCQRRKEFHMRIRDLYNPLLRDVVQEYIDSGLLKNAYYVNIFDVEWGSSHINDGDCFHPSAEGHRFFADEEWCRSHWGTSDLCVSSSE